MCMGYAKDIAAWACQGELNRREAALLAWGETWLAQRLDPAEQGPQAGPARGDSGAPAQVRDMAPTRAIALPNR
ncbi:hypothetical protein JY96_09360 [Aquabacterium sp. NJ1]|nr:hypothetical protein JY96_09360 [Aquabacterium sp. NJ1]